MKRTIPLLITAAAGYVIIVSQFIPATIRWGEVTAVWFDILAAIAFVLGGGSLLKMHLRKVSDRAAGWGYSVITLVAFLATLIAGLGKIGARPSPNQEFFGESFAELKPADFPEPLAARIEGSIPERADGAILHASVRRQLRDENGQLVFVGWMRPNQKNELLGYEDQLDWKCRVEQLYDAAQPPESLAGKVAYYADHSALSFQGFMTDGDRQALFGLSDSAAWRNAVEELADQATHETTIQVDNPPAAFQVPASLADTVSFDRETGALSIRGPMSSGQRNTLAQQPFGRVRPFNPQRRQQLRAALEERGRALTDDQARVFDAALSSIWSVDELHKALEDATVLPPDPKTACELLAEMNAGVTQIEPYRSVPGLMPLNDEQAQRLERFADDETMTPSELGEAIRAAADPAGDLELVDARLSSQQAALQSFLQKSPTIGSFKKDLCMALLRAGPLTVEQRNFLLDDYRAEYAWQLKVWSLFEAAHQTKYRWSGNYREAGSVFIWLFEYAFKPLTATMFALLAFFVASAAFRAFRAKNLEAMLLLGTAFIILLGRTFAGALLTSWLPEGYRIDDLTVFVMSVFNTAGNRAIMIGIALGIASTSLKVLLGVDRSYLGSQQE